MTSLNITEPGTGKKKCLQNNEFVLASEFFVGKSISNWDSNRMILYNRLRYREVL